MNTEFEDPFLSLGRPSQERITFHNYFSSLEGNCNVIFSRSNACNNRSKVIDMIKISLQL